MESSQRWPSRTGSIGGRRGGERGALRANRAELVAGHHAAGATESGQVERKFFQDPGENGGEFDRMEFGADIWGRCRRTGVEGEAALLQSLRQGPARAKSVHWSAWSPTRQPSVWNGLGGACQIPVVTGLSNRLRADDPGQAVWRLEWISTRCQGTCHREIRIWLLGRWSLARMWR